MPFDFQVPHIICIPVSSPPLKNAMPSFSPSLPLKSTNYPSPPPPTPVFKAILPSILVFHEPVPLKVVFFSEPPKYSRFSSLTPSYLLKVIKFLVKISWFEFLFMTEKNIFAYKRFWSWNISDFNLFYVKVTTLHPLKKVIPLLSQQPPCNNWGPLKPSPHFENLVEGSIPLPLPERR